MSILKHINTIKNNKLVKNGFLFTLFSFINTGISFLLLIILARYISPSEYGKLNLFNTLITLLNIIISLNSVGIISVDFFNYPKNTIKKLISSVILISTGVLLFGILMIILFNNFSIKAIGLSIEYQFIAIFICYIQVFTSINLDIWRLEERPTQYGVYSIATGFANFGLTLLLVIPYKMGWEGRIYAQSCVSIIFIILSIIILNRKGYLKKPKFDLWAIKNSLSFGLPLIPHSASSWIRQGLDRYIINFFYTSVEVGYFSFAFNFANIIHIIGSAFNSTNSVYIYKTLAEDSLDKFQQLKKQIKILTITFILITILVYISVIVFIPIVTPQYEDSIPFLLPLCVSALFQCIYYLYVNYIFYYKKTKILMYITFLMSIIHLTLSIILTRYSIMFTAYITLFVNIAITFLVYKYSKKVLKSKTNEEIYNN